MVQNNALLLNVIGTINGNIWQLRKLMGTGKEKKVMIATMKTSRMRKDLSLLTHFED